MLSLVLALLLSDPNPLLEIRIDLAKQGFPTDLLIHEAADRQASELGKIVASDTSFLNADGKTAVEWTFPGDSTGDGKDEVCAVVLKSKKGTYQLRVYQAPLFVSGNGAQIASTAGSSLGFADGDGKVVGVGAADIDDKKADELFVIREALDGTQSLEIFKFPKGKNATLKPPKRSDATFGNATDDTNVSVCGADVDGDGVDEIVCLRRGQSGTDRLLVFDAPATIGGETGDPVVSALDVDAEAGTDNIAISRTDIDGDDTDELILLRQGLNGQRIDIVPFPVAVGGFIGPVLFSADTAAQNDDEIDLIVAGMRGFKPLMPPKSMSGLYAAGLLHTVSGNIPEVLKPLGPLNGTQAGQQLTILLPGFHQLTGLYSQAAATVTFDQSPVTVQGQLQNGGGATYQLIFLPGTVHFVQGRWVIDGEYTGVKKLLSGDLPVTEGNYRFTRL